ncbi:MAG TPA: hypothetical protein VFI17_01635 [Solirubrobacterales bacterium]|nr:hypothetical protein [Solirubrobacterales bacterium]
MIHKIRSFGVTLITALVLLTTTVSSGAAAPVGKLTDASGITVSSATATGVQEGEFTFTVEGSTVACANAETQGNGEDGATWGRMHPTYTECTAFGFINATVATIGCDFEAMATEEIEAGVFKGELKIVCEAGKEIIIAAGNVCEVKVGPQNIINGTMATNVEVSGKTHVRLHSNKSPVKANKTKDSFGCPFSGTGETTATANGTTTIKAYTTGTGHNLANQLNARIVP